MRRPVLRNNRGFTLVEAMLAFLVLLFVSLAMLQTALLSIDSNMVNVLRDEAISIAERRMNDARNLAYNEATDNLVSDPVQPVVVQGRFRDMSINYNTARTVTALGSASKQVAIRVDWTWKGRPYTHVISTVMRRQ